MTAQDASDLIEVLRTAYPFIYGKQTEEEIFKSTLMWAEMFAEEDPVIVAAAVKAFICSDDSSFINIGAIKKMVRLIKSPNEMTETQAWALASKAMKSADKVKAFEALPPDVQAAVGSPRILKEWAMSNIDSLHVIEAGFNRSYRARRENTKKYEALPAEVKTLVSRLALQKAMPELGEGTEDVRMIQRRDETE